VGQQVRVRRQDRLRVVPETGGHDVQRDPLRKRDRRVRVAQDVYGAGLDARRLAVVHEPLGQPLGLDRPSEFVSEHKLVVAVRGSGKVALKPPRLKMAA
jgi:hypothetical protein